MRLKQFLQESITQQEFADVLKNKNLMAGCEFEFYLDEDTGVSVTKDELDDLGEKADDERRKENRRVGDHAQEKRELEDELYELDNKYNDLIDEDADEDLIDDAKQDLTEKQDEVDYLYEKYELSHEDLPNYFKLIETISDEFYSHDLGDPYQFDEACYQGMFEDGEIPSPEDLLYTTVDEILEENSEIDRFDTLRDMDFPLDGNNVTFDDDADETGGKIVEDISLKTNRPLGVEVVTPAMPINKLINTIEDVFKGMKKHNCGTDKTCGFHVHVSLKRSEYSKVDPVKLMLFVEEGLLYKKFEDRINNGMAKSLNDGHLNIYEPFSIKKVQELLNDELSHITVNKEKMMGVHLIDLAENHVEFRYMGAKDYQNKFSEVRINVVNYGHWLSIACDKEYKRKEYARKIGNIVDRYNGIGTKILVSMIQNILDGTLQKSPRELKILNKLYRKYKTNLSYYKKVDLNIHPRMKNKLRARADVVITDALGV